MEGKKKLAKDANDIQNKIHAEVKELLFAKEYFIFFNLIKI